MKELIKFVSENLFFCFGLFVAAMFCLATVVMFVRIWIKKLAYSDKPEHKKAREEFRRFSDY